MYRALFSMTAQRHVCVKYLDAEGHFDNSPWLSERISPNALLGAGATLPDAAHGSSSAQHDPGRPVVTSLTLQQRHPALIKSSWSSKGTISPSGYLTLLSALGEAECNRPVFCSAASPPGRTSNLPRPASSERGHPVPSRA